MSAANAFDVEGQGQLASRLACMGTMLASLTRLRWPLPQREAKGLSTFCNAENSQIDAEGRGTARPIVGCYPRIYLEPQPVLRSPAAIP